MCNNAFNDTQSSLFNLCRPTSYTYKTVLQESQQLVQFSIWSTFYSYSEFLSFTHDLVVLMWSWKFHYKTQVGPIFAPKKWRHCETEVLFVERSMRTSFRQRIRSAKSNNRLRIFPTFARKAYLSASFRRRI